MIETLDKATVEKDLTAVRKKILSVILEQIKHKDLSRSEVAFATKMSSSAVGPIMKGCMDKVSTDRLLRIARRLGIKFGSIRFVTDQ